MTDLLLELFPDGLLYGPLVYFVPGGTFSTGDPPELMQVYESASETITADPSNTQAYFTRGVICQSKGWYQQALADLVEVLRHDPRHARAWMLMSEVLAKLGNHDQAKKARQEALELDPNL